MWPSPLPRLLARLLARRPPGPVCRPPRRLAIAETAVAACCSPLIVRSVRTASRPRSRGKSHPNVDIPAAATGAAPAATGNSTRPAAVAQLETKATRERALALIHAPVPNLALKWHAVLVHVVRKHPGIASDPAWVTALLDRIDQSPHYWDQLTGVFILAKLPRALWRHAAALKPALERLIRRVLQEADDPDRFAYLFSLLRRLVAVAPVHRHLSDALLGQIVSGYLKTPGLAYPEVWAAAHFVTEHLQLNWKALPYPVQGVWPKRLERIIQHAAQQRAIAAYQGIPDAAAVLRYPHSTVPRPMKVHKPISQQHATPIMDLDDLIDTGVPSPPPPRDVATVPTVTPPRIVMATLWVAPDAMAHGPADADAVVAAIEAISADLDRVHVPVPAKLLIPLAWAYRSHDRAAAFARRRGIPLNAIYYAGLLPMLDVATATQLMLETGVVRTREFDHVAGMHADSVEEVWEMMHRVDPAVQQGSVSTVPWTSRLLANYIATLLRHQDREAMQMLAQRLRAPNLSSLQGEATIATTLATCHAVWRYPDAMRTESIAQIHRLYAAIGETINPMTLNAFLQRVTDPRELEWLVLVAIDTKHTASAWWQYVQLKQRFPRFAPSRTTYARLLELARAQRKVATARALLEDIRMAGIEPDAALYTAMLWVCDYDHCALEVIFQEIRRRLPDALPAAMPAYLSLLLRHQMIPRAWAILDYMATSRYGYPPITPAVLDECVHRASMQPALNRTLLARLVDQHPMFGGAPLALLSAPSLERLLLSATRHILHSSDPPRLRDAECLLQQVAHLQREGVAISLAVWLAIVRVFTALGSPTGVRHVEAVAPPTLYGVPIGPNLADPATTAALSQWIPLMAQQQNAMAVIRTLETWSVTPATADEYARLAAQAAALVFQDRKAPAEVINAANALLARADAHRCMNQVFISTCINGLARAVSRLNTDPESVEARLVDLLQRVPPAQTEPHVWGSAFKLCNRARLASRGHALWQQMPSALVVVDAIAGAGIELMGRLDKAPESAARVDEIMATYLCNTRVWQVPVIETYLEMLLRANRIALAIDVFHCLCRPEFEAAQGWRPRTKTIASVSPLLRTGSLDDARVVLAYIASRSPRLTQSYHASASVTHADHWELQLFEEEEEEAAAAPAEADAVESPAASVPSSSSPQETYITKEMLSDAPTDPTSKFQRELKASYATGIVYPSTYVAWPELASLAVDPTCVYQKADIEELLIRLALRHPPDARGSRALGRSTLSDRVGWGLNPGTDAALVLPDPAAPHMDLETQMPLPRNRPMAWHLPAYGLKLMAQAEAQRPDVEAKISIQRPLASRPAVRIAVPGEPTANVNAI
ncbi:hypothetical protein CXG81DRAFT_16266 [Caulochytrium protostelioides]|uniref:Uncharacterized protein n=1 Tax=Caulochytrium protostelioides TaxID=1555241 RepID=A0A4P9XFC8_9FUNG|nr:hypothetical protein CAUPRSCDRAFT_10489 [Caulochytrium protostelioides]RKP04286.1 hypothetical protein CXG81DRAFT_16266 [Caulochytrium protostelioides]|eukprot:RKP04286.1 hypothetical protein CXG81DRAFT_16266 [Caulochytrium protostelioides]